MKQVKVFAPATIANIGPGFDVFGVALYNIGDVVEARLTDSFKGVRLAEVKVASDSAGLKDMPKDEDNLVFPVAKLVYEAIGDYEVGVEIRLVKRMGIGTGLGSSASSSVAAAVAVNEVIGKVLARSHPKMLAAVLEGEFVACGSRHADNVFPSLLGGFVFVEDAASFKFKKFEVGKDVFFVVASPDLVVSTREAREALKASPYNIKGLVRFSSSTVKHFIESGAGSSFDARIPDSAVGSGSRSVVKAYVEGTLDVLSGLLNNDVEALGRGTLKDGIVTPVRAKLIPGYDAVKEAALGAGAKGFSISGSGPSVFAVAYKEDCERVKNAMLGAFERRKITAKGHVSAVNNNGALVVE